MNTTIQQSDPQGLVPSLGAASQDRTARPAWRTFNGPSTWLALLAGLFYLLVGSSSVVAHPSPVGCTGSALGIDLFTSSPDVHIGDTVKYSVTIFNGLPGSPRVACDAEAIQAALVTPDGVSHDLTPLLVRRTLLSGQNDFYQDVASYVVRAQDIRPDGTVRATATDTGVIHQNDTDSQGGGNQGVNTEVSLPCINLTVQCLGSIGQNGLITFSGTVTNCGNNTLVGVTITNSNDNGSFKVVFTNNLLRGEGAAFNGSFLPLNPCTADTVVLVATGVDQFTSFPKTVTSTAQATCATVLTPGILVTKACPVAPVAPGQLLTYTGTVKNTGNVTLTNIVVVDDQPAPNTAVFTLASLAPGEVANFSGSYPAPVNCSIADTLTARAASICGVAVTSSASATCPILTTPKVQVTAVCPAVPVAPGGLLTYTGTVKNTGDIPLTGVVVTSDRPVANTVVFTVATLAPGASANYTGSYTVPADVCGVTATIKATGKDQCTAAVVTDTVLSTCTGVTAPALAVTLACPATSATTGGLIVFTGTVKNTGNVTLDNVSVVDAQASPSTVFTVPSLAPGVSANFTASFTAPADACSVTSTVNVTALDHCSSAPVTKSVSATCALLSTPALAVTQTCPVSPTTPGGLLTYTGTVKNTGNITLTNVVVTNDRSGATPVFTAALLAPGAVANFTGSFTLPANVCSIASTSTARAASSCGVAVSASASATCTVLTTPAIAVTAVCSTNVVAPGGALTYSGTVRNSGDVTLNGVSVTSDRPVAGTVIFTVATLAPGASANFTGSYVAPASFPAGACGVTATLVASGKDLCTDKPVTSTAAANCSVTTAPQLAVTLACPAVSVATGGLTTYTGTVSNPGNVTLNNVTVVDAQVTPSTVLTVPSLAPGASANFTVSFTTPADACSVSTTVSASGSDNCTAAVVTATKSATCALVTAPGIAVTQECPASPARPGGPFTFTGTVKNTGDITLTNVAVVATPAGVDPSSPRTTTPWFDDFLPSNAVTDASGGDAWTWVTSNPAPFSGSRAHQSNLGTGLHQHFFTAASPEFPINPGDTLVSYVYLDPANPPSEVMLQWNDGSFNHRAYWGANLIEFGADGTAGRRFMGALPPLGQWVKLEVPASAVALEGRTLSGMAFTLFGGRATWDATGKTGQAGSLAATTVFTAATLAPGEVASFTGSFLLPTDIGCSVTFSLAASANDRCTAAKVTAASTGTCPLVTSPAIEVTQNCPAVRVAPGSLLTYTGTVRNVGDITLTNVVVTNDRSGAAPVLVLASLAPGASANFTGSYLTHLDCCVDSSTVTARGQGCAGEVVSDTATKTCPILTTPKLAVTKVCAPGDLRAGDLLTYTGTVSNIGDITLIDVEVRNDRPGSGPLLGRLTLAPGESANYVASYIVPQDFCGTDTVTATGADVCTTEVVTAAVTVTCPVITQPAISITKNCPVLPTPRGGLFSYTGTVKNTGTVTLLNVIVTDNQPAENTPVFGPVTLAPGASMSFGGSYKAPLDCCETTDTLLVCAVDRCSGVLIKATATQVCPLLTTPALTVTKVCPATPVAVGGLLKFTGSVSNSGDVNLTNVFVVSSRPNANTPLLGPIELAPGESAAFSGSYLVVAGSTPATDTVTATGNDTCRARLVTARADCAGTVPTAVPVISSVALSNGTATVTWSATAGTTYRLQCKGVANDPIWIDIPGDVTADGATASKSDLVGPTPRRFYRIVVLSE